MSAGTARPETTQAERPPRVRRFEPSAVAAVISREMTVFARSWPGTTFTAIVEPTIYLIGFGFGLGAILARVAGVNYIEFLGTGMVASAVLFSSALPAMFTTFVKRRFQRIYDVILTTPIDVAEIVTAEVLWLATRAGLFGTVPLFIAMAFGLDPAWGMLVVPLIGFLTGFGFAAFGVAMSAVSNSIDRFNNISSGVLTPLLLLAGVFFPIAGLPEWVQYLALLDPLYHCVELVRHASFGFRGLTDLAHLAVLLAFAVGMLAFAVSRMRPKLIG